MSTLPASVAALADRRDALRCPSPASPAAAPQGVRVLVADDDPQIRRATVRSLTRHGFEVQAVDDGAPAIALGEQTRFDLALIDLGMPTSGLDVVRKLKAAHGPAIHIDILTAEDHPDLRMAAFDAGADGFLVKPIPPPELVRRLVASARSQQAFIAARQSRDHADRLLAWGTEAAALLAHDLNNGLAVALSNVSYLSQVLTTGDDEQQALAATLRVLRRMSGLVANFVDITRFEEDALRACPTTVRIQGLLRDVMGVHAPTIGHRLQHSVECAPELSGHIDEALVARVLHNIVGNAVRYCSAGGTIRVRADACPEVLGEPPRFEISVSNTGPYVPPALAPKLFGKHALGKDGQRGLGLYFCRLACEAHGGSVRYEPRPEGPTFILQLPRVDILPEG